MSDFWELILAPFAYPFEPGKRIFWLFLLSSLLLAAIVTAHQQRRFDCRQQLSALFNPKYWLHRSSRIDMLLLFINSHLRLLLLVPIFGGHLAATILVAKTLQTLFGDAPAVDLPWLLIGLAYTISFFLLEDLSRFCVHYLMHKLPWLWRFHRLHHSAEVLTPLTVFRVHPVEAALYHLRGLLVFGTVSGVFVYCFGRQVHGFDILGVDALGFLFNFCGANLRHSPIWLSFGKLETCFISPAQHQIHHSRAPEHRGKNLGTCLAIWDRLAGTWYAAGRKQPIKYGIAEQHPYRPGFEPKPTVLSLSVTPKP